MSGDNEATGEQSSVCEGSGYDEVFLLGHGPKEGLSWSSEREPSVYSPVDEKEDYNREEVKERDGDEDEYDEGEGENEGELKGEDDKDEEESNGGASVEGSSGSPGDGYTCFFILPGIWTVNDFKSMMTTKFFNNLRDHYQIPNNIPICLPGKYEKCYSWKTADVGMYDAMFAAGLRLPLTTLHCQLAIFLGQPISQIALNAWRIFIGAKILWGRLSRGNRQLTLDEFFWCYRP